MTSGRFNDPGILDLSALKKPAPGSSGGSRGAYVTEVATPNDLQALVSKSLQHVVVLEFYSARAQGGQQLSDDLIALSTEAQGKWLLARADCDAHPELPQAVGIQAVPTVVAMIGGQLAPLFQGVQPKEAIRQVLDQVLQTAAANGIMGKTEPVAQAAAPDGDGAQPVSDPRFAAADEALARGDYAGARDEFDKLLAANPNDAEAKAGKAQAGLLARSTTLEPGQALAYAAAHPDDHTAQLAAADVEVVTGNPSGAFDRIITLIRTSSGDERDALRERLLELFETVGATDPAVLKARRALSAALF
ncbi:tetratricopeptide repeat protein [Granulicoccus phenolivorans]|uniref:tetratricopeptide repeat protein n=1 Tax=Granulicoccus phenolivorans TaxID=266854 RepID=UPI00042998E9|nr:tetratricopeptide repeat protein [Granulicoccus phenolivorans]